MWIKFFTASESIPCPTTPLIHGISRTYFYRQVFLLRKILLYFVRRVCVGEKEVSEQLSQYSDYTAASLSFRRRIKSRLPFAGIIRRWTYSTRFQDKG